MRHVFVRRSTKGDQKGKITASKVCYGLSRFAGSSLETWQVRAVDVGGGALRKRNPCGHSMINAKV